MSRLHPHLSRLAAVLSVWGLLILPGAPALQAQQLDPDTSSPADIEFFEKQVRPILFEHCLECHGPEEDSGGLRLDSRQGWMAGGDSGPAIIPGVPKESLMLVAIGYQDRDLQMPPKNKLNDDQIETLTRWVSRGAPDPRSGSPQPVSPMGMSIEDGRQFWSFRPLADPAVPQVSDASWVRTPIDAFIMRDLELNGLQPAEQADRRTLLRRVTYDLTGMPPTPEEIDAFVADESPEALERVVERLLASQRYGVRWGRHWLDVARYADSNGLDENLAFGNAWRYRDYVIDSFNQDKPFDQFLIEQIAGDLIPHSTLESKTATGYLVLGAKVLAEPDREKLEMDTIDEQLDAMGKAFLAMSFGCVRCHDHKFDPIKQSDYYSMAAILKSTKTFGDTNTGAIKHWHEHVFATDEELAAIKKIDEQIAQKQSEATKFKNQAMAELHETARAHAADYLVAATRFEPTASLNQVAAIAAERDLHPRVLHHCRLHLDYHTDDPFFEPWHRLRTSTTNADDLAAAIDNHYRPLFAEVQQALAEARKTNPKANRLDQPRLEMAREALFDDSGFLAIPPKPEHAFDSQTLARYDDLMEQARITESRAADVPSAMGVDDGEIVPQLPIHVRGSHLILGDPVERAFPAVMRISDTPPIFPTHQSGRLELARWMADSRHPLTARVYVNRIWRWHFGEGLVRTTENFGILGDRPSNPELLDWLARQFIASGWSTKELHRLILRSSVYRMASAHRDESHARQVDPENRLWWKFPTERLQPEAIRDSILAISGQLDESMGGKTVPLRNRQFVFNHTSVDHTKYNSVRRAAYLPVIRNNLYTFFAQFDFPDPTMPTGDRNATVVAPQALWMMNAPLVMDAADEFAKELVELSASDASRIELAYERTLGRPPTEAESTRAIAFIDDLAASARSNASATDPEGLHRAWSLFCQSLFASNEFIYLR